MGDNLLSIENVHFAYGSQPVLADISLTCSAQGVVALMGPSGCGKTTLLSLMLGLLKPDAGRIVCAAQRLSVMFQEPLLLPWRTAIDNVAFALKGQVAARREREEKAVAMLKAVELPEEHYRQFPHQLSGGMRQRVSLARALVVEPDMLLLDEPFHGLDFSLVQQMQALLCHHVDAHGMGLLMVTHDARHAVALADEILLLTSAPARVVIRFENHGRGNRQQELALADEIEHALMGDVTARFGLRPKA
nr:ATP-binding cassette domain-containing protein [uncultured Cohaesibacter sp.]